MCVPCPEFQFTDLTLNKELLRAEIEAIKSDYEGTDRYELCIQVGKFRCDIFYQT